MGARADSFFEPALNHAASEAMPGRAGGSLYRAAPRLLRRKRAAHDGARASGRRDSCPRRRPGELDHPRRPGRSRRAHPEPGRPLRGP
ncbi:MAG: hypothetical protein WKG07_20615 [Hymenobacter sp.]